MSIKWGPNNIKSLDAIIYTHEHADQTTGIFEMRPFYWKNNNKIPVYASARTIKNLKSTYTFCFTPKHGYKPIMKANVIKNKFQNIYLYKLLKEFRI